jgi:beta-glucosidase
MYAQRSTRQRLPRSLVVAATVALAIGVAAASAPSGAATELVPYQDPSQPVPVRVADLLSRMTLEEKIGQMTQAERGAVTDDPSRVTDWMLGSVLSGGGSVPTPNNAEAWADMVDEFQQAALNTRLGIPLLYGVDSVHGHGNLFGATVFPHNIGLGATRDPDLVRRVEHITAEETRASGPQWAFAPCICAARDDRWGRTYESFSENPRLVERMETAIDGFQGPPGHLADRDRVLRRPSTTPATATRCTGPPAATTRSTRGSRSPTTRTSGASLCANTSRRCRTTTSAA